MKIKSLLTVLFVWVSVLSFAQDIGFQYHITLMEPGNPAKSYPLKDGGNGSLSSKDPIPVEVIQRQINNGQTIKIEVSITGKENIYYNFEELIRLETFKHEDCEFLMPGFWYHRNLRSPKEAPSFATSDSWQVREDRLSSPLTGVFDRRSGNYYTVARLDDFQTESLTTHTSGDVILSGKTSIGFTGFKNVDGTSSLVFGFPYHEAPKSYIRKLTLVSPVRAFEKLAKGETRKLTWEIRKGKASGYSDFVADTWSYVFDTYKPKPLADVHNRAEAKKLLSNFYKESFVDKYDLKYYSGVHLRTDDCISTGSAEVGFVGRVLLNAFNALEYGEEVGDESLVRNARAIFDSYLSRGFTKNGFFREFVELSRNEEPQVYSIRRQSEGVFAILNYLAYDQAKGRRHPEWESKIKQLLVNFSKLQQPDGSFPRKFNDEFKIEDESGGSTPSATVPLTMAYSYFGNKRYLESARKSAAYLEREIISKADYFSSTLDANCEDKEASLYASTAMYYLAFVTSGKERARYIDLCAQAAYFCLSWYYTWDVPFAQGQMLGDVGFKSRGWGNVSVENNHVDVFIFEFATVLEWLANQKNEQRFSQFSDVIKSSMLQLMPREGHKFNIAKVGYYPEVVQHTNWDYGKNGKGFYNDIFAPGWTVASLWQMLSPERVEEFFARKKK